MTQMLGYDMPQKVLDIIEDLEASLPASLTAMDSAVTLPPPCYTDPDFFEYEKRAVFFKEWLCVGRVEQVKRPGDYFSVTLLDEPLIIARTKEDEIVAMSAVCRHRGMIVTAPGEVDTDKVRTASTDTAGNCDHFRCPYHHWMYDLEGRLVSAPDMDRTPGFNVEDVALPRLRSEVWNGFVFVNFDPDAPALAPRLKTLTQTFANWNIGEMVDPQATYIEGLPWNWKVMHENSMEAYHAERLHAGLHDPLPGQNVVPVIYHDDEASVLTEIKSTHRDYGLNPSWKNLLPVIDNLTEEERTTSFFALIPPTLLMGTFPDSVLYRLVFPTSPNTINIRVGMLVPGKLPMGRTRAREVRKRIGQTTEILGRQDFAVDSAVQKGLRSVFAPRGALSWQEDVLLAMNRWIISRYQEGVK